MSLSGNPIEIILIFWAGVLVSLTPCIFPLIPITAGYIGASSSGSRLKGFTLSLCFVFGMALTYAALGLIAVLSGTLFGKISTHPLTNLIVGAMIVIFGLSMLDLFSLPAFNLIKLPALKKKGYLSAFLLGLASGLVISPCLSPALGSILVYLASKKNLFYGAAFLFSFAFGMGVMLILVGTFSAAIIRLPRSGNWMSWIKKFCAAILIGVGLYYAYSGAKGLLLKPAEAAVIRQNESGSIAPDFTLQDLKKNEFSLSAYRGKQAVVLFFWTTWCPYCREELKKLNSRYADLAKENIVVLAINIEEPAYKVESFLQRHSITMNVLLDRRSEVAMSYGVLGVPTFCLVDKQGFIVYEGHEFPSDRYQQLLGR